jgi:hypothetical protein
MTRHSSQKYCIECGKLLAESAKFCWSCGSEIHISENKSPVQKPETFWWGKRFYGWVIVVTVLLGLVGLMVSSTEFGLMHDEGNGVAEDDVEASLLAVEPGDADVQAYVSSQLTAWRLKQAGRGTTTIYEQINRIDARLTPDQKAESRYIVGSRFADGRAVPVDSTEAAWWYQSAATMGHVEAQLMLGSMYDYGDGVPLDQTEAVRWYRMAAEQGDADAQLMLGSMYARGDGVTQDDVEAMEWYRLAAEQGSEHAATDLGDIYFGISEVQPPDYVKAHKWYNIANALTDRAFNSKLRIVEGYLNANQIDEAQRLAREWHEDLSDELRQ